MGSADGPKRLKAELAERFNGECLGHFLAHEALYGHSRQTLKQRQRMKSMRRALSWVGWMPAVSPAVIVIAVYVAWYAAYAQLGRLPVASMDDPKYIGGMSTAVFKLMSWLILLAFGGWTAGFVTTLVGSLLPRTERRARWIAKASIGFAALAMVVLLARFSPGNAFAWILD